MEENCGMYIGPTLKRVTLDGLGALISQVEKTYNQSLSIGNIQEVGPATFSGVLFKPYRLIVNTPEERSKVDLEFPISSASFSNTYLQMFDKYLESRNWGLHSVNFVFSLFFPPKISGKLVRIDYSTVFDSMLRRDVE